MSGRKGDLMAQRTIIGAGGKKDARVAPGESFTPADAEERERLLTVGAAREPGAGEKPAEGSGGGKGSGRSGGGKGSGAQETGLADEKG